ncbi:sugar phosphate isomerase/epimerase family protein [Streptomyces sp. NPDC046821]|uniref:sugar phosphate isomerase/epimerase family protein n=1 Tax=Streptomyces sp. NPDC046821 TaxID=3154702 RepID=UPI0033D7EDE8
MQVRIGIDGRKIPDAAKRGPVDSVRHAHELGMEGVFFRTVLDMSPTLDPGLLRDIRDTADELGLYLESGLGKVNPFASGEAPELRRIGDGDTLLGFTRMIRACAEIGCTELWAGTANRQPYPGRFSYDRFRSDAPWEEQLAATGRFLKKLAPVLRETGVHLNLETHEEVTSFEVVRLVEEVGPDVVGIVFDTSNVLHRAEDPVRAAHRVAPYVRQTHLKDAVIVPAPGGVILQTRPIGDGVVDFSQLVPVILAENPAVNLTMESRQPDDEAIKSYPTFDVKKRPNITGTLVEVYNEDWLAGHPDLTVEEFAAYLQLSREGEENIAKGGIPSLEDYAAADYYYAEAVEFIQRGARHLRNIVDRQPAVAA